jgi:hypothetical protein
MTRHPFGLMAFALLAAPLSLTAQTGDQSNLVLSIYGGVSAGHNLWHIGRQPLCLLQGGAPNYAGCAQSNNQDQADTLELDRQVSSSIMIGAAVSYFKNPYIGFQGEIYYLGLSFNDSCHALEPYLTDSENKNQQMCNSFAANGTSASAVSFIGSVILRASPRHAISPYLRTGIGITTYSGGTLAASGQFISLVNDPNTGLPMVLERPFVVDTTPKTTSVTFQLAAGITSRLSPGYQIRFEVRDAIFSLERLIGPANDFGQAPHESKLYHHIALAIGLDIVLEHKRGRRY